MKCSRCVAPFAKPRQQGVTLLTTLIFLVVLGMLGVTVARQNQMEERMAGNTRNRDVAFQAAEAILAQAEANLAAGENWRSGYGSHPGYRDYVSTQPNDANYWSDLSLWNDTNSHKVNLSIPQAPPQLRYIVDKFPPTTIERYRITARGLGGDSLFDTTNANCDGTAADPDCYDYNAVVILQIMVTYTP